MPENNGRVCERNELLARYKELKALGLKLNLTRGKPGTEQVALSDELDGILDGDFCADDGTDARNYGGIRGLPEARQLGSELLGVPSEQVIAGGNSSLQLMHLVVQSAVHHGLAGPAIRELGEAKAICPVPGYDRHFTIMEWFGIEMLNVDIQNGGPDMGAVEKLVFSDRQTRFIWCVPKYSNPTGCTYSSEAVEQLALLPRLRGNVHDDPFYVLWDNAYAVHGFGDHDDQVDCIYDVAKKAGTEDRVVLFASTSKITHAGAGIAFVAGSNRVLKSLQEALTVQTVGPDKVNQLRHVRLLRGKLREHMFRHAGIVKPKFSKVQEELSRHLGNRGIARWSTPSGGYFVSLDVEQGCARRVVQLASDAGLSLTPAGATFPYGTDPHDKNIRIAPTFARLEDLPIAIELLSICVHLASMERAMPG